MKERIKLNDFIKPLVGIYECDDIPKPDTYTKYFCSCGKTYSEGTKFCSVDGLPIETSEYEVQGNDYEEYMRDMLYCLQREGCPSNFEYEFVDSIEKRGDGSGYYMNFIFKRKSDGKFFYYTSYDGRIEEDELEETKCIVTTKWDFEKSFS